MRIRLGDKVAEKSRFVIGDKMIVQFDFEARRGRICAAPEGWTYSSTRGSKDDGKMVGGAVRPVLPTEVCDLLFPNGVGTVDATDVRASVDQIEFSLEEAT